MSLKLSPFIKLYEENQQTLERFAEKNLSPNGFCLVPFTNLILEPGGQVGICRHKGSDFIIGNIQETPLDQIWNNDFLQKWRQEFLDGKPTICAKEIRDQHCNLCRQNNQLLDLVEFEAIQSKPFIKLTANLNGKCNLQCQMCNVWKLPNGFYKEENFWKPGREKIFPLIKEIDMLSGEPFIQKDTFKLIDEVSAVNPNCKWMFTTNAHWELDETIEKSLKKIFIKYIVLSVDSLKPETYARIRKLGDLSIVLKNIELLLAMNKRRTLPAVNFHMNFLVQKDNWQEPKEVLHFCQEKGIIPFLTFLYRPSSFSLLNLEESERIYILETYFKTLDALELNLLMKVLLPLANSLTQLNKAYFLSEILRVKKELGAAILKENQLHQN